MGDSGGHHRDSALTLASPPPSRPPGRTWMPPAKHMWGGGGGQKPNRSPTPKKLLVRYLPIMLTAGEGSLVPPFPGSHRPQLCSWGESNCPQDYNPKSLGLSPLPSPSKPQGRASSSWGRRSQQSHLLQNQGAQKNLGRDPKLTSIVATTGRSDLGKGNLFTRAGLLT